MEGIRIPYSEVRLNPYDLTFFDLNSHGMFFDSDTQSLVIFNPSELLIEELENRAISYEKLTPEEVKHYLKEYL